VNVFVIAAIAMLAGVIPCGIVACRGTVMDAVVAYEALSAIVIMVLLLLADGFGRSGEFELAVVLAVTPTTCGTSRSRPVTTMSAARPPWYATRSRPPAAPPPGAQLRRKPAAAMSWTGRARR
jgi:hypothetical protein